MNPTEIKNLPPSMQRTYEALKKRLRFPDNRIYLAPVSAGHVFAESRNDAMRAFVVQGAGRTLAEEEPDGVPKPYHAFLVKDGFPGIEEVPQETQPPIATPPTPSPTPATAPAEVENA